MMPRPKSSATRLRRKVKATGTALRSARATQQAEPDGGNPLDAITSVMARGMTEQGRNGLQEHVRKLVQHGVRRALDANVLYYHTYTSRYSPKGFPDVLVLYSSGRLVVAELKRENAKPTPEQVAWLNAFSLITLDVYLWKPSHWLSGEISNILFNRHDPLTITSRWKCPGILTK